MNTPNSQVALELKRLRQQLTIARQLLERINRATPSKPQVLIKLIQVCEQMRDYPAAVGYLKHALRCRVPDEYLLKSKRPLLFGREVLTAVVAHWIHPDTTC